MFHSSCDAIGRTTYDVTLGTITVESIRGHRCRYASDNTLRTLLNMIGMSYDVKSCTEKVLIASSRRVDS